MSTDLQKLETIDKTKTPSEQLKQVDSVFFKEYPENIEPRDGKMNCLFLVFLVRLDPFHVLNYIFAYDMFMTFILGEGWFVLGFRTGSQKNKAGCALVVMYMLILFIMSIYLNCCVLWNGGDFKKKNLIFKMKFWLCMRTFYYFIFTLSVLISICALMIDTTGAWAHRDKIAKYFKDDAVHDTTRLRMLGAKEKYRDSYDTELIAYSQANNLLGFSLFFNLYGLILGFIALHAAKRMEFDQFVGELEEKANLQENNQIQIS